MEMNIKGSYKVSMSWLFEGESLHKRSYMPQLAPLNFFQFLREQVMNSSNKNMDLTQTPTQDDSSIEFDQPGNHVKAARVREIDPKAEVKILKRRVMATRICSRKNRIKQYNYNMQLEGEVRALQVELAVSNPRIKYTGLQNSLMRKENDSIKKTLYALSTQLMWKEAQCEELKRERDSLKQFCMVNLQPLVLGMNQHQPPAGFSHPNMAHPGPAATEVVGTAGQMRNMNHLNQQELHNFFCS